MPKARLLAALFLLLPSAGALAIEALVLDYREWEHDRPAYDNRVTITPGFLRQDIGTDTGSFLLFDRAAAVVYSIDADEHTVLEMAGGHTIGKSPIPLELSEHSYRPPDAPKVAGRPVVMTEYRANGDICTRISSVPGLSPKAVAAWQEFDKVMAEQRAATLANTPRELLDPCMLATAIFAPLRHLRHGLPIREDNPIGISRELRDLRPGVEVDEALFHLPEGYRRIIIGGGAQ